MAYQIEQLRNPLFFLPSFFSPSLIEDAMPVLNFLLTNKLVFFYFLKLIFLLLNVHDQEQ
jgi:hypothetical protein